MKSNPSVKEQIREVLDKVASRHMKGNPYYYIDQAQEAILKIIESEVIGEDEHAQNRAEEIDSGFYNLVRNALRESQREKLS